MMIRQDSKMMNSLTKPPSELQDSKGKWPFDSQRCGLASNKNPILSCDCGTSKWILNTSWKRDSIVIKVGQCLLSSTGFETSGAKTMG